MKTGINEALLITFVMGAVIFFCRVFPFLFFGKEKDGEAKEASGRQKAFLGFVEKTVPPAAMTVLAFNSMTGPVKGNLREGIPILAASVLTALIHLWRRNPLISIFCGTALYMILERVII